MQCHADAEVGNALGFVQVLRHGAALYAESVQDSQHQLAFQEQRKVTGHNLNTSLLSGQSILTRSVVSDHLKSEDFQRTLP